MVNITKLNQQSFQSNVIKSELPVILDFWGPQCSPCKQLDPLIAQLATEYAGKIVFYKVVAPENTKLCVDLRVIGLPTFLSYMHGEEIHRIGPQVTIKNIKEMIEDLIS